MDIKKIEQMGMEQGFSHVVLLDCDTIELKPEVRQMCAADTCHKYDKCWSCPPGCGSLEECEAKVRQYKYGIIVQTVGELEDVFDGEGMMETEARHKEYVVTVHKFEGSQANKVLVYAERLGDREYFAKWLYTACTRAVEQVVIVM